MRIRTAPHHRFRSGDESFVYASTSASILKVDALVVRLLEAFDVEDGLEPGEGLERFRDAGDEAAETLDEMIQAGLVVPADTPPLSVPEIPPMPYPLGTLVLNVTNKCNLSCTYCYEYGEDRLSRDEASRPPTTPMMPAGKARESIDFLLENCGDRRSVTITFFGGETLLNFETIRSATLYAEERCGERGVRVGFALTTNATLLTDEVIDFIVAHRFGVNVSIDGPARDQDRHRTFKSGRGTYDVIAPRIRRLLERNRGLGRPIGARVTLTAGSLGVRDLYDHLVGDLGFDEVGFAPVTSAPGRDYALSPEHYSRILEEFSSLAEDYVAEALAGRHHGFSNLNDLLRELHLGTNKAHPCGAGLGLLGVSTEGELGLCHRFVESGAHSVGDVSGGIDEKKRREFLQRGHVSQKIACGSCFARPVCSGGCYHEAYVRYEDPSQPNLHSCEWIRAWTALGLSCYARIMQGNPGFFERFENSPVRPPAPGGNALKPTSNESMP